MNELVALVVEDEDGWFQPIEQVLMVEFGAVERARNYKEATERLATEAPVHLLVTDLFLPAGGGSSIILHDGGFLLAKLFKLSHAGVGCIICTKRIGNEELAEARELGAAFVYKGDIAKELPASARRVAALAKKRSKERK